MNIYFLQTILDKLAQLKRMRLSATLLFSFIALNLFGFGATAANYIKHYNHENGLLQVTIGSAAQDGNGYLYFGTQDGLVKFDGIQFVTVRANPKDPNSFASNRILALASDIQGNVIIGTTKGLSYLDYRTQLVKRLDPNFTESVSAITVDAQGNLWVGGKESGLYLLNTSTKTLNKVLSKPLINAGINQMVLVEEKFLWLSTSNSKLLKLDINSLRLEPLKNLNENLKGRLISSLSNSQQLGLIVGYTDHQGIDIIETSNDSIVNKNDDPIIERMTNFKVMKSYEDSNNQIWFGTENGIVRYNPNTQTSKVIQSSISGNGLINNAIRGIFEDNTGNIWIGTTSGLNKITPELEAFGHQWFGPDINMLTNTTVTAVFEDENHVLWVGTYGGGLLRFLEQTQQYQYIDLSLNIINTSDSNFIISLNQGPNGRIWVGTTNGLVLYNPVSETAESFNQQALFDNQRVNDIQINAKGQTFFRTNKGLFAFDSGTQRFCEVSPSLGLIKNVFIHKSNTWILPKPMNSVFYQLNALNEDCSMVLIEQLSIAGLNRFEPFLIDQKNNIWAAAGGLSMIESSLNLAQRYTEQDGLPNNTIYGALEDDRGNIWASTNKGITKLDINTQTFTNYTYQDGLQSNEFNGETAIKRKNGQLVFGGMNGLNVFDPASIKKNQTPPLVSISSIKVLLDDGEQLALPFGAWNNKSGIELAPNHTGLEIEFIALHFQAPLQNKYRFILDGFDKKWTEADAQKRIARYTNLSPGDYQFKLVASNSDDVWTEQTLNLSMTVARPWYITWWAYLAYVLFSVLLFYTLIKWRLYELKQKNIRLEEQVKMRTLDIAKQKQTIEKQVEELKTLDKTKERFFENISHEFRTPLTLTIGPLKRLFEETKQSDIKNKLEIPIRQSSRLLRLINQFLDISRLSSGVSLLNKRCYRLADQIRQIVIGFKDSLNQKDINLVLRLDDDILLDYDASAMEKIVVNLLSNAINYSNEASKITLKIEAVQSSSEQGFVNISVEDQGVGISDKAIPTIFERFNIEKNNAEYKQGIGVGLALVKELVELHQGNIKVESCLGKGSCFTISIPITKHAEIQQVFDTASEFSSTNLESLIVGDEESAEEDKHIGNEDDMALSTKALTILIVDDEADMRHYLKELLTNYIILFAENGREAFNIAQEYIPDLIISDVMMPVMNGLELVKEVKEHRNTSHIPIILLTAKGGRNSKLEGLREGVDDYIVKPYDDEELRLRVQNILIVRKTLAENIRAPLNVEMNSTPMLPKVDQRFIDDLDTFLAHRYLDYELNVDDIAKALHLEKRQLQRKLKGLLDTTPSDYLRTFRLQKAAEILLTGDSVNIAFEESGFANLSHFSRCFKAAYGISPSQYFSAKKSGLSRTDKA